MAHRQRRGSVDDRRPHFGRGGDCGTASRMQRNTRHDGRTAPTLPSGEGGVYAVCWWCMPYARLAGGVRAGERGCGCGCGGGRSDGR